MRHGNVVATRSIRSKLGDEFASQVRYCWAVKQQVNSRDIQTKRTRSLGSMASRFPRVIFARFDRSTAMD